MNRKLWIAALLVAFVPLPAAAQVYDNAPADYAGTLTERRILERNLQIARNRQNGQRGSDGGEARKAQACADRARFSREYGADHPNVRQLHALCARHGY